MIVNRVAVRRVALPVFDFAPVPLIMPVTVKPAEPAEIGRRVVARIVEIRGKEGPGVCSYGHQVGDEFGITEICPSICPWAFNALFPFATVLRFGGSLPWEDDPARARVCCPDPENTVIFELAVVD